MLFSRFGFALHLKHTDHEEEELDQLGELSYDFELDVKSLVLQLLDKPEYAALKSEMNLLFQ